MDILADLNPAQKEAVESASGPLLILAGPGSGKTRVITHRVAYLVKVWKVNPHRIMAVTFTNKAAREMETRLKQLVGSSVSELTLGTFHAICARFLRIEGKAAGIDPQFVIYDDGDQLSLLKRSVEEVGLDPKQYAQRAIQSAISAAKSQLITPHDYILRSHSYFEEVAGRVYERYEHLLAESNALDFDDLLLRTVQLFQSHPEILAKYQNRYLHILVDEFQDTNLVQYELVKQLAGKHRNICVVGDPDQSIYSWRSADLRNILNFEKDYPDARVVFLEQNYRSTKLILEMASHVISANEHRKEKNLWTENETGEPTIVVETYNEQEEAQFVVNEIEQLVRQGKARLGDCAIMYRTNAQSRVLEETFIRYGTPYKLVAGTRFYERREVKDIISYFRIIQNPNDSISLLRVINVPGRGIGERTIEQLSAMANSQNISLYEALQHIATSKTEEYSINSRMVKVLSDFSHLIDELVTASKNADMVELFDLLVKRTGYRDYLLNGLDGEERWENILELRTVAQQYQHMESPEGLREFLQSITLVSDVDGLDESLDTVTLITLHQAKGLEFPVVFIAGLEDGILPHFKCFDDPSQMEEERRLLYVGITRARKKLYLVRAFRRSLMGNSTVNKPSRFLQDIPSHLISGGGWHGEEKSVASKLYEWDTPTPSPNVELPELKAGDHVRHPQFGEGVITGYKLSGKDAEVVVVFDSVGIKKLLMSFAKLEKLEQAE